MAESILRRCSISRFPLQLCFKCETMIAYLSGKLLEKRANTAIVDVGGVGYEVSIPLSTFYELGDVGSDVSLRIYTYVREDAIQLFGFKTLRERELYLRLISVQGIGAKSGITMLSGMSADEIIMASRTDDLARLTSIPGVGRKTAERLVIELRDKVGELSGDGTSLDAASRTAMPSDAVFACRDAFNVSCPVTESARMMEPRCAARLLMTSPRMDCNSSSMLPRWLR